MEHRIRWSSIRSGQVSPQPLRRILRHSGPWSLVALLGRPTSEPADWAVHCGHTALLKLYRDSPSQDAVILAILQGTCLKLTFQVKAPRRWGHGASHFGLASHCPHLGSLNQSGIMGVTFHSAEQLKRLQNTSRTEIQDLIAFFKLVGPSRSSWGRVAHGAKSEDGSWEGRSPAGGGVKGAQRRNGKMDPAEMEAVSKDLPARPNAKLPVDVRPLTETLCTHAQQGTKPRAAGPIRHLGHSAIPAKAVIANTWPTDIRLHGTQPRFKQNLTQRQPELSMWRVVGRGGGLGELWLKMFHPITSRP